TLLETWEPVLPPFITHQILEEIVVPRIISALETWSPRSSKRKSLPDPHVWIFPWLPLFSSTQTATVLSGVKRVISSLLQSTDLTTSPPETLTVWREILDPAVLDNLFVRTLLPRLASHLR